MIYEPRVILPWLLIFKDMEKPNQQYEKYMERVLELAEKGRGRTSPNPMVGALVIKNGEVVGEGYHTAAGKKHAEVVALENAGEKAKGAVLISSLEPCCTAGKTPPCTEAIKKSGISKVVIGLIDPNPLVNGKGLYEIRSAGIEVFSGVLNRQIARQNEIYVKYITSRYPFVLMKTGMSLNGMIATPQADRITGEKSHQEVHILRDEYDAIVVGIGTIFADDPLLTARPDNKIGHNPIRVVIDSKGKLPLDAKVITDKSAPTIIATTEEASLERLNELSKKGVEVLVLRSDQNEVDLWNLMDELGRRGVTSVLLEGGARIYKSAVNSGIVDKYVFFIAPRLIGGSKSRGLIPLEGLDWWQDLRFSRIRKMGEDLMIEAYPI